MTRFRRAAIRCGCRLRSHLALVLAEDHVPHPVETVLNPPVPPPYAKQTGSVRPLRRQAGYGIHSLQRLPALAPPPSLHTADLSQSGPVQVAVQGCRCPQPAALPTVSMPAPPGWPRQSSRPREAGPKSRLTASFTPGWLSLSTQNSPRPVPAPSGSTPADSTGHHWLPPSPKLQLAQQSSGHPQFALLGIPLPP